MAAADAPRGSGSDLDDGDPSFEAQATLLRNDLERLREPQLQIIWIRRALSTMYYAGCTKGREDFARGLGIKKRARDANRKGL